MATVNSLARIQQLGRKANQGILTAAEDAEYEQYIEDGDLIALLQAKVRGILGRRTAG